MGIKEKVSALEAASRPPKSGPVLEYTLVIREEDFIAGVHEGTTVSNGNLVLADPATTGTYTIYLPLGREAREAYILKNSLINWTTSGGVNVYVSRDPNSGWTQVSRLSQIPVLVHNASILGQNFWVRFELVANTSPSVSLLKIELTIQTADNHVEAPWPTTPDVSNWLWKKATPDFWKDTLGVDTYQGSLDYKFFSAIVEGVRWARILIDRYGVRISPHQADEVDIERIKLWVNADPIIVKALPDSLMRSYLDAARGLARYRGTELLSKLFESIFGIGVDITWKSDKNPDGSYVYPHRRVVIVSGPIQFESAKVLLRRTFPASVEIELHFTNTTPPKTDYTWTGFDSSAIGEPAGTFYDYGWTLAEGETVELI